MLNIYYSKQTGEIYAISKTQNKQGFEFFTGFAEEMSSILDVIYAEDNEHVFKNKDMYKIKNGTIVLKQEMTNIQILD